MLLNKVTDNQGLQFGNCHLAGDSFFFESSKSREALTLKTCHRNADSVYLRKIFYVASREQSYWSNIYNVGGLGRQSPPINTFATDQDTEHQKI